jgi:hypothetical protein
MMVKRIEIFVTPSDTRSLLAAVEQQTALFVVKVGSYASRTCTVYASARAIPELGITHRPDRLSSDRYMLFPEVVEVVYREVPQNSGTPLFMVDPWQNAPCLLFTSGGIYQSRFIISGLIETASKEKSILSLFFQFMDYVTNQFFCVSRSDHNSFVGPEALSLLRSGWRLTDSISAPPQFDVSLPDEHPLSGD